MLLTREHTGPDSRNCAIKDVSYGTYDIALDLVGYKNRFGLS